MSLVINSEIKEDDHKNEDETKIENEDECGNKWLMMNLRYQEHL